MAVTNSNDWFGNFIMNYIQLILGAIIFEIGLLFVLIGQPTWALNTITSFKMMPPMAKSWAKSFN